MLPSITVQAKQEFAETVNKPQLIFQRICYYLTFTFKSTEEIDQSCDLSEWMVGGFSGDNLKGMDPHNQYLLVGGLLNGEYPIDEQECWNRCQQLDSCLSVTFKTHGQQCWLKGKRNQKHLDLSREYEKSAMKTCYGMCAL